MPAYLVAEIEITDPAGYEEYRRRVPASIAEHGGRYPAGGGAVETLEGDGPSRRVVVLEFPSRAEARRWYDSPSYRELRAVRQRCSRGRVLLVEGV